MNSIATERSAQDRSGFFRRIAKRFCEPRMLCVKRKPQHRRHILGTIAGRIEPIHVSADGAPEFVLSFAPRPAATNANGLSSRHYKIADFSHSRVPEADVIPFRPRRFAGRPQADVTTRPAAGQRAKIIHWYPGNFATNEDDGGAEDDEDDYHRRMFENLAATAWVGTLMTSAYYVFSTLLAVS